MQVCTWCRSDVVQGGYGAGECGVVQWCSVVQGESGGWQVDGMVQNEVQGVVRGKCGAVWCRSRVVQVQMVQGECGAGRVWCSVGVVQGEFSAGWCMASVVQKNV